MSALHSFVHLHLHSQYSLLDGANKIDDIITKSIEFGMPAVAVTDHGNMFGAVEFYKKATHKGVKPIIGCEVYVAPGSRFAKNQNEKNSYHLILLAMNEGGYKNLCKLISMSYIEGFYYKPRIDKEILKEYSGGLIALSSCLKGEIPRHILSGNEDEAVKSIKWYSQVFEGERFYLEVQENGLPEQNNVNKTLLELAKKYSLPLVATNDCHYLMKDDYEAHDVLLCIQTGKTVEDQNRMKFASKDLYFKSGTEMAAAFKNYPDEIIGNTNIIARICDFNFKFGQFHFPGYKSDKNAGKDQDLNLEELFELETKKGFEERFIKNPTKAAKESYLSKPSEYSSRLEMEIETIKKSKYAGYFLIVSDFIKYAKEHNIPVGPGRGSAAGSLVAYCLKITDIDPIKYDLLFERFLNPERISMPDIDSDFCINGRDEVIRYVAEKYGEKNVSQIITFGTMLARAVIRDTGRALNMPYGDVDRIAKLVPDTLKITLDEAIKEEPKLQELIRTDPKVKKLIGIALKLEGLTRHASTHAAGVVIANKPLDEYLPLYKGPKETDAVTTQFTMEGVEKIGLIKFDFLGLKTLTVIKEAIRLINENNLGSNFDIYDIDLNDVKTYKLLSNGDTTGVFQLESSGMKELLIKIAPACFEDIIPLVALYRPGPLGSGMVDDFIKAKHGLKKIKYLHPLLKDILQETYGVILYQEQIMRIAIRLANFSMGDADVLRKGVGKKNAELIEKMRNQFIEGCEKNSIQRSIAEKIFSLITKFGEYGFNKSHSTAYTLVAYMTGYLKANYKDYFMAALLSSEMSNADKLAKIIGEVTSPAKNLEPCSVTQPSINSSMKDFTVFYKDGKNVIQVGLAAVKNVGYAAIESILSIRNGGPYKDLLDFCARVDTRKVNKRTIESLIKSGALDISAQSRSWMLDNLEQVMQEALSVREKRDSGESELPLFGFDTASDKPATYVSAVSERYNEGGRKVLNHVNKKEILSYEKEALGFYLSGHPLDGYEEKIRLITGDTVSSIIKEGISLEKGNSSFRSSGSPGKKDYIKECINGGPNAKNLNVILCGMINQLKEHRTRNGEKMASFILSDATSNIQVVFFPKTYSKCHNLFKTAEPVVITGKLDIAYNNIEKNTKPVNHYKNSNNNDNNNNDGNDGEDSINRQEIYSKNNENHSDNIQYSSDYDYNIKIIGESVSFLDSYAVKQKKTTVFDYCTMEFSVADFSADSFKPFILTLKDALLNCKGASKVLIKINYIDKCIEVELNDDITVDIEALKRTTIAKTVRIT